MITLLNNHLHADVAAIILILIGLTGAKFYGWVSFGEFLSLVLEVVIVLMISPGLSWVLVSVVRKVGFIPKQCVYGFDEIFVSVRF
jgi:hypothetical protein